MNGLTKPDPDRPKRIEKSAEDVAQSCDNLKKHHANKALEYGYARDTFKDVAHQFSNIDDDPSFAPAENVIDKYRLYLKAQEIQIQDAPYDASSGAYAIATSVTATTSIVSLQSIRHALTNVNLPKPPDWWERDRKEYYAKKLEKINHELGKLLRSVWECFHAGQHEPERTALSSMRQLFDHFFDILAPNDRVRESIFFTKKTGDKPMQVSRSEKIKYAANTQIPNKGLVALLEAQTDYALKTYDDLNKLHTRGMLDREEVLKSLTAMQTFIEQWLDGLNL